MGSENKDPLKSTEWKAFEESVNSDDQVVAKKRVHTRIRQIPDYYFLASSLLSSTEHVYIAGGIGAGMLLQVWINKKVEEDGGIIWDFDKNSRRK